MSPTEMPRPSSLGTSRAVRNMMEWRPGSPFSSLPSHLSLLTALATARCLLLVLAPVPGPPP